MRIHGHTYPLHRRRGRLAAAGLAVVLTTLPLAGCADDGDSGSSGSGSDGNGKTTLSVGVFGVFGYKQAGLYDEYEKLNPDIKIKENSTERNEDYYPALLNHLAAGAGLNDIQAAEVQNINELATVQSDKLVDLGKADGVKKSDFLDWKWNQAKAENGKIIGLGTDSGPMAICYRKDLFQKAGLPTEREEVGKLWAGDWKKYVDTGETYMKSAPKGTTFTDSAAGLYNGAVSSYPHQYYSEDGELDYKKSEGVKASWDLAMRAVEGKMTGKLKQFDKDWDQAYANGTFASVICPSWMLAYIQEKAGDKAEGQWDVAAAPEPANWGGSFLTVPEKAKNKEEAIKLATWLTAPEQQAKVFQKAGNLPSSQTGLDLPKVKGAKHSYFNNAPIGEIFSKAAKDIPVSILGPKDQIIKQHITDIGILQVEQQGKSPDQGWDAAVKKIDDSVED
ncbi:extracellular solute-binding protein [Streptomyces boncukensis]|uniref:Extracellular solute-binding protein n=1 Tax=Streptomyces boncukensis TaxID=2711219 RepID=A0A6G4X748_9ACTN|nr:extracellular solute-binding protein [Streptomyces boncukensis]NGO73208.1 extracellular solute-binding protein [Streptomyces boncukensis]